MAAPDHVAQHWKRPSQDQRPMFRVFYLAESGHQNRVGLSAADADQQTALRVLDRPETRAAFRWVSTGWAEYLLRVSCSDLVRIYVLTSCFSPRKDSNRNFDFALHSGPFSLGGNRTIPPNKPTSCRCVSR